MENCPCGSELAYVDCCEKFHSKKEKPLTAETLMRSRYSAFVTKDVDYIVSTHDPKSREELDAEELKLWAEGSDWQGLEILKTDKGQEVDTNGQVEFKATYVVNGTKIVHHELSNFEKVDGNWFFMDGEVFKNNFERATPKVGRNEPCPCGSGKKFKKCCGR